MTEFSLTFDEVADTYDAVRPTYPPELVAAVCSVLPGPPGRILEIGCGTGQATVPFAQRGYRITALEPGRRLAALAARNLAAFPQADVQATTLEEWPDAKNQFDLVMSATAFHWVSPEIRYVKSAQALTPKGWLALFWNVEGDDESVLAQEVQAVYDRQMPPNPAHPYATHHPRSHGKPQDESLSRWREEIEHSHLFGSVSIMQFPWAEWYPTERYLQLLETYSDHRALPPENKCRLFDGIAEVLARHGGGRTKPYVTLLYLAQRRTL